MTKLDTAAIAFLLLSLHKVLKSLLPDFEVICRSGLYGGCVCVLYKFKLLANHLFLCERKPNTALPQDSPVS